MKMDQESDLFNLTDYTNGKIFYEIWEDNESGKGLGKEPLAICTDYHVALMIAKALHPKYKDGINCYKMQKDEDGRELLEMW